MRDFGQEAQAAAEKRLDGLWEALDVENDGEEVPDWPADLEAPFCGCQTCVVRETLQAAWPIMLDGARTLL